MKSLFIAAFSIFNSAEPHDIMDVGSVSGTNNLP